MSTPTILVASDSTTDAALVKNLLNKELENVFTSTDPDKSAEDFVRHPPDVLVLAFYTLEKSQHYYLRLFRLCTALHLKPYRTIILCHKDELRQAYALCRDGLFDDYIPFWPMVHDALRLPMSVHLALRELAVLRDGGPTPADFAAQVGRLEEMGTLLDQQMAQGVQHIEKAGHAVGQAERGIDAALAERIRPTVLIVDDDEFQHKIISKMLGDEKYHLVFATGGVKALKIMRTTPPDLILMDVVMPALDGLDVMQQMKTESRIAGIPVIMMTGKGEKDIVKESLAAGAVDFMVKPFARDTLLGKVAKVLRGT